MQNVMEVFALAIPNIKAILMKAVGQNVYLILTVLEIGLVFETNVLIHVPERVDKMLNAVLSIIYLCAVVDKDTPEMLLYHAALYQVRLIEQ